jgi:hypothetical protein|tara:strand:- start:1658 stop:2785 length:1128 start_codon:yes stop_codon:yes gene_type:complete
MSNNIKSFKRNATKENPNNFTEDDVDYHYKGMNRLDYPILDRKFKTVELQHPKPELVLLATIGNSLGVDHPNQEHRQGGSVAVSKYNKLERSFDIGINLNKPCPVVFEDDKGKLSYITGHTRHRFYTKNNFEWIMVYKYKTIKDLVVDSKTLEFELLQMGQASQDYEYYSNDPSIQDAEQFGLKAFSRGHLPSDDNAGVALRKLYDETYCGKYFTPKELTQIIHSVISEAPTLSNTIERRPMWSETADEWMIQNDYVDTDSVLFVVSGHDFAIKTYAAAVNLAQENPDKKVRIVFHAGVLDGRDPETMYNNRRKKAWNDIKTFLNSMQMVVFNNRPQKPLNLEIYGMIPQLGSVHNFQRMNRFDKNGNFKKQLDT